MAAAHFAVLGLAVMEEAREARSAAAHVEQYGERSHYAHNERTCIACMAQHLVGPPPRHSSVQWTPPARSDFADRGRSRPSWIAHHSASSPRAPPHLS
jgi:cytochrome c5